MIPDLVEVALPRLHLASKAPDKAWATWDADRALSLKPAIAAMGQPENRTVVRAEWSDTLRAPVRIRLRLSTPAKASVIRVAAQTPTLAVRAATRETEERGGILARPAILVATLEAQVRGATQETAVREATAVRAATAVKAGATLSRVPPEAARA